MPNLFIHGTVLIAHDVTPYSSTKSTYAWPHASHKAARRDAKRDIYLLVQKRTEKIKILY